MKKSILILCAASLLLCSSCATIFGGRKDDCQTTRPAPGQQVRQVRPWAIVGDIGIPAGWAIIAEAGVITATPIMAIAFGVDLLTNHLYKPCKEK